MGGVRATPLLSPSAKGATNKCERQGDQCSAMDDHGSAIHYLLRIFTTDEQPPECSFQLTRAQRYFRKPNQLVARQISVVG
jgi:hypothetical protein